MSEDEHPLTRVFVQVDPAELRLSYQDALENIRWAKRQQWLIVYYTVLMHSGLIAFAKFISISKDRIEFSTLLELQILYILTIAVSATGIYFTCNYQLWMRQERARLHRIRDRHFSEAFHETMFQKEHHEKYLYRSEILLVFIATTIVAS